MGDIAVLRHRHRKRSRLIALLRQLTTQQLILERKLERKARRSRKS